jgi:hypothetical protein
MPKEVTHWLVAQRAADQFGGPLGEVYGAAIRERWPAMLLAAVFHDALYYLRDEAPAPVRELPQRMHGQRGEDTHELLRLQIEHIGRAPDQAQSRGRIAAFVGLASHIATDARMHPAVYYLTGRYDDPDPIKRTKAVQRHRLMETIMDIAACQGRALVKRHSLSWLLDQCGGAKPDSLAALFPLESLAKGIGAPLSDLGQALASSFSLFATLQGWFKNDFTAGALYGIKGLLPNAAKEILALFYAPQLDADSKAYAKPIPYAHPVTGESSTFALKEAMESAAKDTLALCREFAPAVQAAANKSAPSIPTLIGPSLVTGLPNAGADKLRFFASPPLYAGF